jgi:hypothetical protein
MKSIVFIHLDINKLLMIGHMLLVLVHIKSGLLCWDKFLIIRLDKYQKQRRRRKKGKEKLKVQLLKPKEEKNLHLH